MKFYKVGGIVRDDILGIQSKDIDFAVECSSFEEMVEHISSIGEVFISKPEYFTVKAKVPGYGIADYVMCRKDGAYSDGRRPDKVEPGTIEDDLARRDFTINAMAIDMQTGERIDPFNGMDDIRKKIIRCVGSPSDRFNEDALRMLRAIRFSITKDMLINVYEHAFLRHNGHLLQNVSEDRIREELEKCFKHNTLATLSKLNQYSQIRRFVFSKTNIWLNPTMKSV